MGRDHNMPIGGMIGVAKEDLLRAAASGLSEEVVSEERVGGGRNAQVFRLTCKSGRSLAAKVYYLSSVDPRDRLGGEFDGLTFLWENGIRAIPEPLLADREAQIALYSYIEGAPVVKGDVAETDIDSAVAFLSAVDKLKTEPAAAKLQNASEACFSLTELLENIQMRFNRLFSIPGQDLLADSLHRFLKEELRPFWNHVRAWSLEHADRGVMSLDAELPVGERTLSPSDFGFHNALRRQDGQLVFLDFEYFGWDDPAKLMADFILHPAMGLDRALSKRFLRRFSNQFRDPENLLRRLEVVFPLFGIKWCLILLNEFIPVEMDRRRFSQIGQIEEARLREAQLKKSFRMLKKVRIDYERTLHD